MCLVGLYYSCLAIPTAIILATNTTDRVTRPLAYRLTLCLRLRDVVRTPRKHLRGVSFVCCPLLNTSTVFTTAGTRTNKGTVEKASLTRSLIVSYCHVLTAYSVHVETVSTKTIFKSLTVSTFSCHLTWNADVYCDNEGMSRFSKSKNLVNYFSRIFGDEFLIFSTYYYGCVNDSPCGSKLVYYSLRGCKAYSTAGRELGRSKRKVS